jgi:predicted lipoprotein with Yx(FWY)xxD motif
VSRMFAVPTVLLALGSVVALAACGGAAPSTIASAKPAAATAPASAPTASAPPSRPHSNSRSGAMAATASATLTANSSRYGTVLFDGDGRALYTFASDRARTSTCYGACAAAWPPFTVSRPPKAGVGIRHGLLGTIRRKDGSLQVTYAEHPLYYFTGDRQPGQITCQNVSSFGGLWLVINPNGTPVR